MAKFSVSNSWCPKKGLQPYKMLCSPEFISKYVLTHGIQLEITRLRYSSKRNLNIYQFNYQAIIHLDEQAIHDQANTRSHEYTITRFSAKGTHKKSTNSETLRKYIKLARTVLLTSICEPTIAGARASRTKL